MKIPKQILLLKNTKTNEELIFKTYYYLFDLSNKIIRQSVLDSLSKRYNTDFDEVIELK